MREGLGWVIGLLLALLITAVLFDNDSNVLGSINEWLGANEAVTASLRNVLTTVGIAVGGSFALYKYGFEGAYSLRLQLKLDCEVLEDGNAQRLIVSAQATNIGKRNVGIDRTVTRAEFSYLLRGAGEFSDEETIKILQEGETIVPGQTVSDTLIVTIPDAKDYVAVNIEFRVSTVQTRFRGQAETFVYREMVSLL